MGSTMLIFFPQNITQPVNELTLTNERKNQISKGRVATVKKKHMENYFFQVREKSEN